MKIQPEFRSLPTSSDHNCFACSPANASGLKMTFFTHNDVVFSRVVIPEHLCGWNSVTHGGVISTILDETMSWAAMVLLKRLSFTQTMTVEFKQTVPVGAAMEAEGRVLEVRDNREAVVEGILTDLEGRVCATSRGSFRIFAPAVAKRLKIVDDNMLAWFHGLFDRTNPEAKEKI
jgi:acyl-coenzyme A thioesterase PaaI-like protein